MDGVLQLGMILQAYCMKVFFNETISYNASLLLPNIYYQEPFKIVVGQDGCTQFYLQGPFLQFLNSFLCKQYNIWHLSFLHIQNIRHLLLILKLWFVNSLVLTDSTYGDTSVQYMQSSYLVLISKCPTNNANLAEPHIIRIYVLIKIACYQIKRCQPCQLVLVLYPGSRSPYQSQQRSLGALSVCQSQQLPAPIVESFIERSQNQN